MYAGPKCLMWLLVLIPAAAFSPCVACSNSRVRTTSESRFQRPILYATTTIADTDDPPVSHQRNIVVLSHNVSQDVVDGIFDINNLLFGRIDVLARCASSALWVSNGIRKDTNVFLMLFPHNITIEIQGANVRSLNPDERTMALYIQRTLLIDTTLKDGVSAKSKKRDEAPKAVKRSNNPRAAPMPEEKRLSDIKKGREAMIRRIKKANEGKAPLPGFVLHRHDTLQGRLDQFSKDGSILMLSEIGEPLWDVLEEQQNVERTVGKRATTLILGNQLGYSAEDEKLLAATPMLRQVSLGPLSLLTSQCMTITHHYLDAQTVAE